MKNGYLIFLVLYLVCLTIRNGYELLKRAGKIDPENKILFAAIFLDMIVMWVCWFAMCPIDPSEPNFPSAVRWAGLGLFVLGLALAFGALIQLRGVENIDHLVTSGLFARLRHPMYTGFILWIIGWGIFHEALYSLIAGLAGIASVLYWRWLEDEDLTARYGEIYRTYQAKTWF